MKIHLLLLLAGSLFSNLIIAQHQHHNHMDSADITSVEPQPFLAQAMRLQEALSFLGSALPQSDIARLKQLQSQPYSAATTQSIQQILDPYCLATVTINPESRVKVSQGAAAPKLIQGGWKSFIIKVKNEAGITAELAVQSRNSLPPLSAPSYDPIVKKEKVISMGEVANRFVEMAMYHNRPMLPNLSGLAVEYAILQVYCKDAGAREIELGFNVGQGTQDIGFRNTISMLFHIDKSVKIIFDVKDDDGTPAMASFIISDGIDRLISDSLNDLSKTQFRLTQSQVGNDARDDFKAYKAPLQLKGIYPLPGSRVAAIDEYPDFFFQPQIYRADGETVNLPAGKYYVTYTRGPEYITQHKEIIVPNNADSIKISFQLKRWINMAKLGWVSADSHIHASGCSHYDSPEEGVPPATMIRQAKGEDLGIAAMLSWGPGWYHQKSFFTGAVSPLSTKTNIMRYDVEVSGFPSSHAGHLVLLNLKEDDYPNSSKIDDWPSWTLPVLSWGKMQGGLVGYAHSGWGLQPLEPTNALPNYIIPKMDNIGANEYIVAVTQNLVDFYSAGDTPATWELNMWYHTLNAGFRPRLSGETDFPCITDRRVGQARSYFKPGGNLTYQSFIDAIKDGHSYMSEGGSHLLDFKVNELEVGTQKSELNLPKPQQIKVTAKVAAYLSLQPDEKQPPLSKFALDLSPYWSIERARISDTRKVGVELIVNGESVDTIAITADGKLNDIAFNYTINRSSWVAIRVFPSSHSNPIFITINNAPIRVKKSIEWCIKSVDQCWKKKNVNFRQQEQAAALAAYEDAKNIYRQRLTEAVE